MSFPRMPFSPAGTRVGGPVLAIGQRARVVCPSGRVHRVMLTDDLGVTLASLSEGVEVEIVAWRPRGPNGTRYRVRSGANGLEGWLGAASLRSEPPRPVVKPVAVVVTPPARKVQAEVGRPARARRRAEPRRAAHSR